MRRWLMFVFMAFGAVLWGGSKSDQETTEKFFPVKADFLKMVRELALAEPQESDNEDVQKSFANHWSYTTDYRIIYADRNFMSFRMECLYDRGWMHPFSKIRVGSISRKTGRLLTIRDLVPRRSQQQAMLKAVREVAARQVAEKDISYEQAHKEGYVTVDKLTDNYYFCKEGVCFLFNQYEIACYAAGVVECIIPRAVIKKIYDENH